MDACPYKCGRAYKPIILSLSFDEAQKWFMLGRLRACVITDEMMREGEGLHFDFCVILRGGGSPNIGISFSPSTCAKNYAKWRG
jgi:hypothetical protein